MMTTEKETVPLFSRSIISTKKFDTINSSNAISLGAHEIGGFDDPMKLFG
jgi:hypothetical protein